MTNYPTSIDNDRTIIRIDDNLSEFGTQAINQLRDAVFAIEKTLGINPQGSKSSVNERISVLLGPEGNPKAETLQAIGLATLPITNNQVADNAGIKEMKLDLNYSTSSLHSNIVSIISNVTLIQEALSEENANFLIHISGGLLLVDNITKARHVVSHIDLNAVPFDSRDSLYIWTGLLDVNGNIRSATTLADALLEINNELVGHETATTTLVHPATAISVDTTDFTQIPSYVTNVQEALEFVDDLENLSAGVDRATLNSNGIPRTARIQDLQHDGYTINVVPVTKIRALLAAPNGLVPNDNIINGDDVITFLPENVLEFDSRFTNVCVGDILRINYGNGLEAICPIMSVRFVAGEDWAVRVNVNNLFNVSDGYDGYARIDRPNFDNKTWGVLAAAGVYPDVAPNHTSIESLILGSPQGAVAVGLGFDPNKIDSTHYNLYLRFYPTGNPAVFYDLPAVDISGNQGTTPGCYNIDIIVERTNEQFRAAGYNYRFIAFNHKGEFGIMLADSYNNAAFSIISGSVNRSTGTIETGSYTLNVIGDADGGSHKDALGLGQYGAGFASPVISGDYPSSIAAANWATLILYPVSNRNVIINGQRRDTLAKPRFTEADGYWNAVVSNIVNDVPNNTIRVTYSIALDLATERLAPGKTIVVLPADSSDTSIKDYGRFIIDDLSFSCDPMGQTNITVLNSIHGTAVPMQATLPLNTNVRIYFSDDSVMFNLGNMNGNDGTSDPIDYHHYHEVFVNNAGRSVAIERARISHLDEDPPNAPVPIGVGNIGSYAGWRIRRVSPKLKGYRVGTTTFRYFVYLAIDSYNSTTGEFDVYITSLDGLFKGPIARGKKNYPVRVYDETYVNFVDIEYREEVLGGTVLPTGSVAIELFPTLSTNDEHFLVAGISHNGIHFKSVTDLREFGNTSEENFTDSAIRFIESGERYIHTNGVVRGFKHFTYISDPYTLSFSGGLALVNGKFVPVANSKVNLPVLTGSSVFEHFICVNETGQLVSVIKNTTGSAFFDSSGNFAESFTFKEIVDNRKDLTIIAKAVIVDGYTVTVTDARRHIVNQDSTSTYSWSYPNDEGDNNLNASFITAEALMNWVNEYEIEEVVVKEVTLNSKLTLNFTHRVVLKGGLYVINSIQGLNFGTGNWTIDGAEIYYIVGSISGGASFDSGDAFNTKYNWGGILIDLETTLSSSISDFGIINSKFYSSAAQRPPFVGIYSATGISDNVFSNGKFINNTFTDSAADTSLAARGLCYAFVNGNIPSTSVSAPFFSDIIVSNTKINKHQGIIVTGRATPKLTHVNGVFGYTAINSVLVENFVIKDNRFGLIGYNVSNAIGTSDVEITKAGRFVIDNNEAELIYSGFSATMHPLELSPVATPNRGGIYASSANSSTGNSVSFMVSNNHCYFLKVETTGSSNELKSKIMGNTIEHTDNYLYRAFVSDASNAPYALVSTGQGHYPTNLTIADNTIDGFGEYLHGIYVMDTTASITGNTINNIATSGWGIWNYGTTLSDHSVIVGNTLHKEDGVVIAGYIATSASSAIYGNVLSHANIGFWSGSPDGYGDLSDSNFDGIVGSGATFAAWNINQVVRCRPRLASAIPLYHLSPESGTVITEIENNERLLYGFPSGTQVVNKGLHSVTYQETYGDDDGGWTWTWSGGNLANNDGTVGLIIPVSAIIPDRAYLLSFSISLYFNSVWGVEANGSGTPPNTKPEIVLDMNGITVDSQTPWDGYSYNKVTLTYQSDPLTTGTRPAAPQVLDMVVKLRQGSAGVEPLVYGGWVGPIIPGLPHMRIGQPWITYTY